MLFYHYTSVAIVRQIIASGVLRASPADGVFPKGIALTNDASRFGHNVADGRRISLDEAVYVCSHMRNQQIFSVDLTECRIVMGLEKDSIVRAGEAFDMNTLKVLDIKGWNPTWDELPEPLVSLTSFLLEQQILQGKAGSWHFHHADIPKSDFARIEVRSGGSPEEYLPRPTDFFLR